MGCLKVKIKQGEEINIRFTLNQYIEEDGEKVKVPIDLQPESGVPYSIRFQVKKQPLVKEKPIIDKLLNVLIDPTEQELYDASITTGYIDDPHNGKFFVHFLPEDTSFNTGEYYLILSMVNEHLDDIISSSCCNGAKFIICEQ